MSTVSVSKQYAPCAIFTHPLFCRNLKRSDKFSSYSSSEIVFEVLHDRIWAGGKWIDCRKKALRLQAVQLQFHIDWSHGISFQ